MGTDLTRIGEKARKDPELVFTSLYHHITDIDNLRASYDKLLAHKASGIDGVTKEEYGKHLEENLRDLSSRLKRMGYRPSPKRRTYVPKPGSEKGRPLGISNFEDKIVEEVTKRTLEPIYEAVFEDSSYGYRPRRSPHQCLDALGRTLQQKRVYRVVEADIKAFFDTVNHAWLMKFLKHRIGDERVLRLIVRMLKSGILEDGLVRATEQGTPQGSILSPLLSNIYLHYVLDVWFSKRVRRQCQGEAYYFRFADDFLACFQYKGEAERFRFQLEDRLEEFGLKLAMEKTHCLEFGRYARENAYKRGEKPKEFTFHDFITLRRRSDKILEQLRQTPGSAWRQIQLSNVSRAFRTPKVLERMIQLRDYEVPIRQLAIRDLGHDKPTLLLTNQLRRSATKLIDRYAQRMLIENGIADGIDFFHMDALSSAVAMKVNCDLQLTLMASSLYRLLGTELGKEYTNAKSRRIFRDFIDATAVVTIDSSTITVQFQKRAHNPHLLEAGFDRKRTRVPWLGGRHLQLIFG